MRRSPETIPPGRLQTLFVAAGDALVDLVATTDGSHASPNPSLSPSDWPAFATVGQLSLQSATPSRSPSGNPSTGLPHVMVPSKRPSPMLVASMRLGSSGSL